jgi:hypothetical protein
MTDPGGFSCPRSKSSAQNARRIRKSSARFRLAEWTTFASPAVPFSRFGRPPTTRLLICRRRGKRSLVPRTCRYPEIRFLVPGTCRYRETRFLVPRICRYREIRFLVPGTCRYPEIRFLVLLTCPCPEKRSPVPRICPRRARGGLALVRVGRSDPPYLDGCLLLIGAPAKPRRWAWRSICLWRLDFPRLMGARHPSPWTSTRSLPRNPMRARLRPGCPWTWVVNSLEFLCRVPGRCHLGLPNWRLRQQGRFRPAFRRRVVQARPLRQFPRQLTRLSHPPPR